MLGRFFHYGGREGRKGYEAPVSVEKGKRGKNLEENRWTRRRLWAFWKEVFFLPRVPSARGVFVFVLFFVVFFFFSSLFFFFLFYTFFFLFLSCLFFSVHSFLAAPFILQYMYRGLRPVASSIHVGIYGDTHWA